MDADADPTKMEFCAMAVMDLYPKDDGQRLEREGACSYYSSLDLAGTENACNCVGCSIFAVKGVFKSVLGSL